MKRTKGSQSEIGMMYQYGVTAFLAAKLSANINVENYVIYSSDKSAGKFDDVIARVKFKEQADWHLLLIQVKYKETRDLNVSDILKEKSVQYFLSDYIASFNNIMGNTNLRCRQGITNNNMHFTIFCNRGIEMPIYFRQQSTFQLSLINHADANKVNSSSLCFGANYWQFQCQDLRNSEYQQFFDRCYLYLEQPNYNEVDEQIQRICEVYNAKDIINYVKDYFNNEYLYQQGLHKQIFEIELQRMRLYDCIPPLTPLIDLIDDTRVSTWNKITLAHDITMVNDCEDVEVELCLNTCLVKQTNNLLNTNIAWKRYTMKSKSLDPNTVTKFVQYCKTRPFRYWISVPNTIQLLLIELWKCGALPLIIKTYSKLDYIEKYRQIERSFIIISNQSTLLYREPRVSTLKVFACLNNILDCELRDSILQDNFVSLQGRRQCTLKELLGVDDELMATFTATDIIRMMKKRTAFFKPQWLNGNSYLAFIIEDDECEDIIEPLEFYATGKNVKVYCHPSKVEDYIRTITSEHKYKNYTICRLRRTNEELVLTLGERDKLSNCFIDQYGDPLYHPHENEAIPVIGQPIVLEELNYIERSLTRATVSRSFLNSQENFICLISGEVNAIVDNIIFNKLDIDTNLILGTGSHFIKIDIDKRQHYWNKFSELTYPIIDICIKNGELELLRYRNCNYLSSYISYKGDILKEGEFFNKIKVEPKEIIVITGVAGIGKSSLLKSLCNVCATRNYILFYDLIHFQISLFQRKNPFANPLEYIFEEIHKNTQCKYNNFLQCLRKKRKLVVILDSFDEIVLACEKDILRFIEVIVETEVQIIISTRLESSKVLVDKFNVHIMKINSLDGSGDKEYLKQWKVSKNILVNVPPEFTTNPLYLNFLRMVDLNREHLVDLNKFTLYEKVISMNIERSLWRNNRVVQKSEIEQTLSTFEAMALITMFGKDTVEQELMWVCDKAMLDYTKFGIITRFSDDGYPIFYHYSFVEFLVAQWISKAQHIKIYKSFARHIYKKMFSAGKSHILGILSDDIPAHRAILKEDIGEVEKIQAINPYHWHIADKLGRTPLHIATISCGYLRYSSISCYILEMVVKYSKQQQSEMDRCDTIMKWNWTDYIQSSFFDYAHFYNLTTTVEIYCSIRMKNIERCTSAVFPLSNFSVLFRWAIDYLSIEAISTLFLLQNLETINFYNFYKACSKFNADNLTVCDFQLEGELSLLHIACMYGSIPMIGHLIKTGVDVNALDGFACIPLHYSIVGCSTYSNLCPMNMTSSSILNACSSMVAVKLLLESGADANVFSKNTTALHLSVKRNLLSVVEMLLERGAIVNVIELNGGSTPLHIAAEIGNLNIVQRLLTYNANQYIKNTNGKTAWDIAQLNNNTNVLKLLSESKRHNTLSDDVSSFCCSAPDTVQKCITELDKIMSENLFQEQLWNYRNNFGTVLHLAAITGNLSNLSSLLDRGFDVNIQTKYGCTPLHYAARRKKCDVFKLLLESGADVNIADKRGATPLHDAVNLGNVNAVMLLLEEKLLARSQSDARYDKSAFVTRANLNAQDEFGATPLIVAVIRRYPDLVKLLLSAGANVNIQTNEGFTALHIATVNKQIEVVKLLLEKNVNVNVVDKFGCTALHAALTVGDIDIVKLLLSKEVNINAYDFNNCTGLHLAICDNNTDITRILLENGANVNVTAVGGNTPLHGAANIGNVSITRLLLDREVEIDSQNINGMTALNIAVSNGSIDVVAALLDRNADPNITGRDGVAPLHYAVNTQHVEILKLLLNKKADVNAATNDGETPLLLAVEIKNIESVVLLIENEANVNIGNNIGITPLFRSIYMEYTDLTKILLEREVDINVQDKRGNTALHMAVYMEYVDIVTILLEMGANVNTINVAGCTPLDHAIFRAAKHLPAEANHNKDEPFTEILHIIELLLKAGAILDFYKEHYDEVLIFAARRRHTSIVKLLINCGEILNAQDRLGNTPLHIAVNNEDIELVKLLLEKGAYTCIENYQELTPLCVAVENGYMDIVEALLTVNHGDVAVPRMH